jgi:organic hydroperoxide reductase OsmC/OhrA
MKQHHYQTSLKWTGNTGQGTKDYRSYNRNHEVHVDGKEHLILASSDPSFRGDASRYNPEELFLASISNCHMLWYLHLCSVNNIIVTNYTDAARGVMTENANGSGCFTEVTLHPRVTVAEPIMIDKANALHEEANKMCFIANSCNFRITHKAITETNRKS